MAWLPRSRPTQMSSIGVLFLMMTSYPLPTCITSQQIIYIIQLITSKSNLMLWHESMHALQTRGLLLKLVSHYVLDEASSCFINWNQSVGAPPTSANNIKGILCCPKNQDKLYQLTRWMMWMILRVQFMKTYQRLTNKLVSIFGFWQTLGISHWFPPLWGLPVAIWITWGLKFALAIVSTWDFMWPGTSRPTPPGPMRASSSVTWGLRWKPPWSADVHGRRGRRETRVKKMRLFGLNLSGEENYLRYMWIY